MQALHYYKDDDFAIHKFYKSDNEDGKYIS